jgi:hypothetical protein
LPADSLAHLSVALEEVTNTTRKQLQDIKLSHLQSRSKSRRVEGAGAN